MPSGSPRQHYVTASHIERWAEDGQVAVACMYHRDIVQVPFSALFYTRDTASCEQESEWSLLEDAAKTVIDELHAELGVSLSDFVAAETHLHAEPSRIETLIDFVALHHARSLTVPLLHLINNEGTPDVEATADQIEVRRQDAHRRYRGCGIELAVHANDSVPLGAVPVMDGQSWGDQRDGNAEFIMPLSPHILIGGARGHPDLAPGTVRIVEGSSSQDGLVQSQVAGALRLLSSPYLICQPSFSAAVSERALCQAEGGEWHRFALKERCRLADKATWGDHLRWHDRQLRQESDDAKYLLPEVTESEKSDIRQRSSERACLTQSELDALGAQACACRQYRRGPRTSALWAQIMPQVICDAARHKRNKAQ